jgi:cbb3-type cytochrome oxidase maturation protein
MDILFLLIPLSVVLVLLILVLFWWALHSGQFENIDAEGERILRDEPPQNPKLQLQNPPFDQGNP